MITFSILYDCRLNSYKKYGCLKFSVRTGDSLFL